MPWITRKPDSHVALAQSMPLYRTAPARELAAAYLRLLRANGGKLPPKSRLDVTSIPGAVPHLVLCAVTLPDKCIYRVVGEEVKARVGRNLVGLNYYDLVPAERRASAMQTMRMAIGVPCGFRVEMEQSYSNGIRRVVEAAAFPFGSAEPGIDGFVLLAGRAIAQPEGGARPALDLSGLTLIGTDILRRDLIDIGFGTDESYEDLVPAPG